MKIALLGYGKMGKTIEQIAVARGHEIVLKIDNAETSYDITIADVAIEFSTPNSAFANISNSLTHKVPVVAGTTGWLSQYNEAVALCKAQQTAKLMLGLKEYEVAIEEIHHTQKLDAPSGTAITLAEGIIAETDKTGWHLDTAGKNEIPIVAKRIDNTPGTHIITYSSEVDTIEIKHTAHNRNGFALGAVMAAEWIVGKQGVFTMSDVLGINN